MIAPGEIQARLQASREAARFLRAASREAKDAALAALERGLAAREAEILAANAADVAEAHGAPAAFTDRLTLTAERLAQMRASLSAVKALPDPVGEQVDERLIARKDERRPAGNLRARRVRSPLGVIYMIFESRPNVAVEAFSLAFKAGNALILRGGRESMRTTAVIYQVIAEALKTSALPEAALWGITDPDRALTEALLKQKRWIDLVVPRGGEGLIDFVTRTSEIPVIKNDRGLCHVYVHAPADLDMAVKIIVNAKTQRPGVCNAMETLLVDRAVARPLLEKAHAALSPANVDWFACPETLAVLKGKPRVHAAVATSFDTEYLDFKMNARVVGSLDEAIEHIERHGSRHSEAIVTTDAAAARRFQREVDAAAVYWNASTRFTDGFEMGLGGELGISTQKLHVRGPVGLRELTSVRWIMDGEGQVRGE